MAGSLDTLCSIEFMITVLIMVYTTGCHLSESSEVKGFCLPWPSSFISIDVTWTYTSAPVSSLCYTLSKTSMFFQFHYCFSLFDTIIINHDQNWGKSLFELASRREVRAGTETEAVEERCWLASSSSLTQLSYTTQGHLPMGGSCPPWAGLVHINH